MTSLPYTYSRYTHSPTHSQSTSVESLLLHMWRTLKISFCSSYSIWFAAYSVAASSREGVNREGWACASATPSNLLAILWGSIVTVLEQLNGLKTPTRRSASSNKLSRKLIIMNWAFFVLSWERERERGRKKRNEVPTWCAHLLLSLSLPLSIFSPHLNVVCYYRNIPVVKSSINFIHDIKRARLVMMKSKNLKKT